MRSRERGQLANMNLHDFDIMTEAKEEGLVEGAQAKAIEAARNMLDEGDSPEKVSRCVGLSLEQALELQKSPLVSSSERP